MPTRGARPRSQTIASAGIIAVSAQGEQHRPPEMPGLPPKHADCVPLSEGALGHPRPSPDPQRRSCASPAMPGPARPQASPAGSSTRLGRIANLPAALWPAALWPDRPALLGTRLPLAGERRAVPHASRGHILTFFPIPAWREREPEPEPGSLPRLANENCLKFEANESENLSATMARSDAREPIRNIFLSFVA